MSHSVEHHDGPDSPNNTSINITVSAPGKIILHGEHSVVYGKLALASSLDLRTKLNLTESSLGEPEAVTFILKDLDLIQSYKIQDLQACLLDHPIPLQNNTGNLSWDKPEDIHHEALLNRVESFVKENSVATNCALTTTERLSLVSLLYLYSAILQSFNVRAQPFVITVTTDLTVSAGLGSSASYLVTAAAAFLRYSWIKISCAQNTSGDGDLDLISRWGFAAEKIIHGKPSGIDNTICTYGGMVAFRKGATPDHIEHPTVLQVLLINTKVPKSTKALVAKVLKLKENHGSIVEPILESMEAISKNAVEYLAKLRELDGKEDVQDEIHDVYDKLGEIADINQNLLRALGVSHKSIDLICAILSEFNLHCKLTGAGGGGYCIAIVPPYFNKSFVKDIMDKMNVHGFDAVFTYLGGHGIQMH